MWHKQVQRHAPSLHWLRAYRNRRNSAWSCCVRIGSLGASSVVERRIFWEIGCLRFFLKGVGLLGKGGWAFMRPNLIPFTCGIRACYLLLGTSVSTVMWLMLPSSFGNEKTADKGRVLVYSSILRKATARGSSDPSGSE